MSVKIHEAFVSRGCRKLVYRAASCHLGYYTTSDHTDSIRYEGSTLIVRVAFETKQGGRRFYNDVNSWDTTTSADVVQPLRMEPYMQECLDADMIFETDYDPDDFDSPEGSRISVESSMQESAQTLPISSGVVQFQSIQPLRYVNGGGFDRCHIKSRCKYRRAKKTTTTTYLLSQRVSMPCTTGPLLAYQDSSYTLCVRTNNLCAFLPKALAKKFVTKLITGGVQREGVRGRVRGGVQGRDTE